MKNNLHLILSLLMLCGGCKKDKPEPYEMDIYEFQLIDMGKADGYCGAILKTYLDSNRTNLLYFKPVHLPPGITFSLNNYYRGRFEIHPVTYECMDSRPDPNPNHPAPKNYPHMVKILEWEKK